MSTKRIEPLPEPKEGHIWTINPRNQQVIEVSYDKLYSGLVPYLRDTSEKEYMLSQVALYAPCDCGSGKKKKWCKHDTSTNS